MKTIPTIMTIEEIFKLAKEKFTDIPEKDKKDFNMELKDCFIIITFTNGMFAKTCYVDKLTTKKYVEDYTNNNEIEYVVFKFNNEIYSNVDIIINTDYPINSNIIIEYLGKLHYNNYKTNYINRI